MAISFGKRRLTEVALVFAALIAGLCLHYLQPSDAKWLFETYSREEVRGLTAEAPVKYRGVTVGKVTKVGLAANEYPLPVEFQFAHEIQSVVIRFEISGDFMEGASLEEAVRMGLRARVAYRTIPGSGYLEGSAYIELDFVNPERYPVWYVPWTPRTAYIPSMPGEGVTHAPVPARTWSQLVQEWWRRATVTLAVLLGLANVGVFVGARYSSWAWRLATDEGFASAALRLPVLLFRYWRPAQLWILDLYVRQMRNNLLPPPPFLPLPLTPAIGDVQDSDALCAELGLRRHLWIQGGTGMGKSSIFRRLVQTHFGGEGATSFAIFRRDRCVLVPIEARRFAETSGEDKVPYAWVLACIQSVIAAKGLNFEDRVLLRAMLDMGTLGVAIDGVDEVAREKAVDAFANAFPKAPVFVTAQGLPEEPFELWRLPRSIGEHVEGMLAIYLGDNQSRALSRRLRDLGLMAHLRSGYDVRLVVQLAEGDPGHAALPRDRIGLYEAVVEAGWPDGDVRKDLLMAAAWKLVSDRAPNEDRRRLQPDKDAPKDLLELLATVGGSGRRTVRIVRPVPPNYEFVHDQMNAYLAASWLAERTLPIMRDLLSTSKAWQINTEGQRALWGFLAALLDRPALEGLWTFTAEDESRAVLRRALEQRAARAGWPLTLAPPEPEPQGKDEVRALANPAAPPAGPARPGSPVPDTEAVSAESGSGTRSPAG